MYRFLKKIIFYFVNSHYQKLAKLINNLTSEKINFLDLGAAGGVNERWKLLDHEKLSLFLAEPHPESYGNLDNNNKKVFNKIFFSSSAEKKKILLTKKPECSSILNPNYEYLSNFKDYERYSIVDEIECETTTIDEEFKNIDLDFLKIDTQGSEYDILIGSQNKLNRVLGIEIECCFYKLYKGQKLFDDLRVFLEKNDFIFEDFLDIIRWERNNFTTLGQPQFSNVLFLKPLNKVIRLYELNSKDKKVILNYILILIIYNRLDLLDELHNKKIDFIDNKNLESIINLLSKRSKVINKINFYSSYLENILLGKIRN